MFSSRFTSWHKAKLLSLCNADEVDVTNEVDITNINLTALSIIGLWENMKVLYSLSTAVIS